MHQDQKETDPRENPNEKRVVKRCGELAGARTQDPRLKRALLYQLSYELVQAAVSKLPQKRDESSGWRWLEPDGRGVLQWRRL